jgi:hypothetical protein
MGNRGYGLRSTRRVVGRCHGSVKPRLAQDTLANFLIAPVVPLLDTIVDYCSWMSEEGKRDLGASDTMQRDDQRTRREEGAGCAVRDVPLQPGGLKWIQDRTGQNRTGQVMMVM